MPGAGPCHAITYRVYPRGVERGRVSDRWSASVGAISRGATPADGGTTCTPSGPPPVPCSSSHKPVAPRCVMKYQSFCTPDECPWKLGLTLAHTPTKTSLL